MQDNCDSKTGTSRVRQRCIVQFYEHRGRKGRKEEVNNKSKNSEMVLKNNSKYPIFRPIYFNQGQQKNNQQTYK